MAEMKCYTCINFEKAKAKGKIKTSKACDDCWQPDWNKLSKELKQFYILLSKLNNHSFSLFKEFWFKDFVLSHVTPNKRLECGDCNNFKCSLKPQASSTPFEFGCKKWNLNTDKIPSFKETQKELKAIFELDIESYEFPYITFFTEQLDKVNKIKPIKIYIGDKFDYQLQDKKIKLEVEHLTAENVIATDKNGLRMSLLYSSLLNTKNTSKVFERIR